MAWCYTRDTRGSRSFYFSAEMQLVYIKAPVDWAEENVAYDFVLASPVAPIMSCKDFLDGLPDGK